MGLFQSFDISASGMTAERFRMDTISAEHCERQYDAHRGRNAVPPQGCYLCRARADAL